MVASPSKGASLIGANAMVALAVFVAGAASQSSTAPAREGLAAPEQAARNEMVEQQIAARGIRDQRVLEAMRTVPRHEFVPEQLKASAYEDGPLPIGRGQTISQPYVVAAMVQTLALRGGERVLEVGSGSGYAAAVLSLLASEVYGIELEPELHARSLATIKRLGYRNIQLRQGDGFVGWPEVAPFDAILISCAAGEIPPPLWEQLREGGRLVYPRGARWRQELVAVTKTAGGSVSRTLEEVQFVPLRRTP
ncbi:MAG TPA: protein-L-isoaspartate(D-aspartate) O-methyltransferase [Anaeromyxobacteraceae bacterium]|jgi:protein-L-isoaspartate(D-aspartate) O-methyltransferase|nr:protein-L-isoaspartate(D-aspartate) O-methyltransferase [Anaeromyxobacteraceae bacterium]